LHVLVIDDEKAVADLIRRVLSDAGHQCTLAASTDEADGILSIGGIDALTLDLAMPETRGLDWLETLAARDPALAQRTLVVSGSASQGDLERLRRWGAGFLAKPFKLEQLAEAFAKQIAPRTQPERRPD
jgi:CheY-like chemotaxis protein